VRIVWAAAYGGRQRGGFVPALESVARRLIARGSTLDVVVPDVGPAAWHDDVRALGVALHVVRNDSLTAARRVAALRGDVVHAHFHDWLVAVTLATWPSRARLIWHLHSAFEIDGGPLRTGARRRLKYRLLGARVASFVCVTRTIASEARALGASTRKLIVIPNAVDTARFHPADAATRAAARARLGLDGSAAIAFFGRDPAIKGADLLAAALAHLEPITVVAVGTPAGAVADLARYARVVAVPFTDDVRDVLWAVDAIALPSRGEGMPFVALEALACGLPVVASDLPWSAELASTHRAVRLARSADPEALAAALHATLAAPPVPDAPVGGELDRWAEQIVELYARSPAVDR
jgi:glycosyltransferase involved in cell wall biosynthesis